jgi:murein hydrolase activator
LVVFFKAQSAARACLLVACAAGVLSASPPGASGQPASRTIAQAERDRSAAAARAERLRAEAHAARTEITGLNNRLVAAGRRRAEAEAAAADAEARLVALRQREEIEGARYRHDRNSLEAALITAAFAERRIEPVANRAGIFAAAAARGLGGRLRQTEQALAEARLLNAAIAEEQRIIADAQSAIDLERADVVILLAQRRSVQASLNADAAQAERRAQRFAAEARSLRDLAQRATQAAARTGTAQRAAVLPAAWLAPTQGSVTRNFGERISGGPPAQGAVLRTRGGAQVVAPAAGEVAYAGVFRSYGQVLILNLDGGYAVVLTGLETIRARPGERVVAGQPVGEMSGSDTPAPELYVEVRRDGRPIDPARWLNGRASAAG